MDEKDLKIAALRERIAEDAERIADLRVEITVLTQRLNSSERNASAPDMNVVEGELVDDAPEE